ncbi:two-component system sensor histidine kinase YesM [Fontibacillus phaseoli]|uniref:histidine kinase n=1 Tax=Fontibacillus phaseoli TaxID=1416533 RepID=A0A369B9L3_9BACL|nr:sensor histidine kinase [Fontibacillus phaseoli]RCX18212.1 two-component system sensor histidine kinase YesM [Fontibacillus phaseoli]
MKSNRWSSIWDSFMYWFGRRSLQSRLIAAYVFIILGPCVLVSFYSYEMINDMYVRDARDKNYSLLDMEELHIDTQIESMARAMQVAYEDPDARDYLANTIEPDTEDLVNFNNNIFKDLTRIQYYNPNVEHLRMFSSNNIIEIWPMFLRESRVADEVWYRKAEQMKGMESWSFLYNDPDILNRYKGQPPAFSPKVSLLREMSIPANHHVGMVQVDMMLEKFSPRTYSVIQDSQSQMLIVDSEAQIFTRDKNSFLAANPKMQTVIRERLQHYRVTGEWDNNYTENGKSFLLLHKPIERINADLLNIVSMDNVLEEISHTRNLLIGANIGFITLVTIITYIMNAFILKNLRLLTEEMKKLRRGEAYSGIAVRGGGEVGELAHHFSKLMNTINTLMAQAVYKQALTKEAELRTLHNQIDAHFLYNTLENIKMLAEIENQRAISDALTSLGGMMRYNFKWSGEYVKLRDEVRHIENYIEVMNIRFDEPIQLRLDIPDDYMELEVLKMSLQPIVENAVKHAWTGEETGTREVHIRVAEWQEENIRISVTDNGDGIESEQLNRLNAELNLIGAREKVPGGFGKDEKARGIGLINVQERVRLFFGQAYGLEVLSEPGGYTSVVMIIPKVLLTGGAGNNDKIVDRR